MKIVGIDPGLKGGIAVLSISGSYNLYKMPIKNDHVDSKQLAKFIKIIDPISVWIESLLVLPCNAKQSISTMGVNWGRVVGCIEALGIPLNQVDPVSWQRGLFVPKGSSKNVKERILIRAKQLFPGQDFCEADSNKFNDGCVDALLIAKFGMNQTIK